MGRTRWYEKLGTPYALVVSGGVIPQTEVRDKRRNW